MIDIDAPPDLVERSLPKTIAKTKQIAVSAPGFNDPPRVVEFEKLVLADVLLPQTPNEVFNKGDQEGFHSRDEPQVDAREWVQ